MMPEKWESVVGNIKDKFTIKDDGKTHLDEEGGVDIEFIEFDCPLGLIRLEFVSRPVILDKKTIYSRRIGSETKVDYIYSKDEKSHKLIVYKWDDDSADWLEIDDKGFLTN